MKKIALLSAVAVIALTSGAFADTATNAKSKVWTSQQSAAVTADPSKVVYDEASAMEWVRTRAGVWTQTKAADGSDVGPSGRAELKVIAAGSTVMETILGGTPMEMQMMYHMDGPDKLMIDHFCAAKNVPHMEFTKTGKPGEVKFVNKGGTNLNMATDSYGHDISYLVVDKDTFLQDTTYGANGKTTAGERVKVSRVKAAQSATN